MEKNVAKMKVSELRAALDKRGLSTDGLKVDLVHRLQARLDEEEFEIAPPASTSTDVDTVKESPDVSPVGTAVKQDASHAKESPATTSPLVKEADVPAPEKKEDKIAKNTSKDAEITVTSTTEEKKSSVPVIPLPEQKKKNGTSTSTTINEASQKKLTFEEIKAARAKRFGIPVHTGKRQQVNGDKKNKKQKTGKTSQGSSDNAKNGSETKESKTTLTKEEIEQRIKRITRFGEATSGEALKKLDELKAMLRLHRFTKETAV